MSSRRQQQVADLLRDEVSEIIQRQMNDPRLGFVSITRVEMSPDMRYAKLYVSVYASEEEQREALILVGDSGFSYEEAAEICGCAIGTVKSRVNRASPRLATMQTLHSADDFGPDRETRAVLAGNRRG